MALPAGVAGQLEPVDDRSGRAGRQSEHSLQAGGRQGLAGEVGLHDVHQRRHVGLVDPLPRRDGTVEAVPLRVESPQQPADLDRLALALGAGVLVTRRRSHQEAAE